MFDITGGDKSMKSMTMDTIPLEKRIIRSKEEGFSLRTDDIEGAQPRHREVKPRNTFFDTSDIEGSKPSPIIDRTKPAVDHMDVSDIDGAKPRIQRNLPHSDRHVNPLMPVYDLPSYEEKPVPVPRFIRDQMAIDDIPGSHPRSYKSEKPPRQLMDISDISGARPKQTRIIRDAKDRTFDVSDINQDGVFKTKRMTDPLNPKYFFDGHEQTDDFGKPGTNYKTRNGMTDLSLKTDDIEGAKADTVTRCYREFRVGKTEDESAEGMTSLWTQSMAAQDEELRRQRLRDEKRGQRISEMENRNLHGEHICQDVIQATLRKQRDDARFHQRKVSR